MKHTEQPLKIGVIGCGNIAQTFHLPILKYQNQVEVLWLVDTNISNLKKAASLFPAAHQTTNMKEIEGIDAVIITTPSALHFEHVKFALMKGWNVLVEKPLSTNFNDAGTLVALAQQKNLTLCVNLNRRFLPHIKILKDIISTKPFGDIKKIKIFDGGRSIGNIEGEGGQTFHSSFALSGGGAMLDTGSHMVDIVLYLLPFPSLKKIEYLDDGRTGLEAECRFSAIIKTGEGEAIIEGFFSRIAPLSQKVELQFENANVQAVLNQKRDIEVYGLYKTDKPVLIKIPFTEDPIATSFRDSLNGFIQGCKDKTYHPKNSAVSSLLSLDIIDQCYKSKKNLPNPWGEIISPKKISDVDESQEKHGKKVVGIIGAGGFLGSRLFERLLNNDRYIPRALTYSSVGSFAVLRYTDKIAIGDAQSPDFLRKALEGVDIVVNCAINMGGMRRFAIQTTRNIAKNAARISAEMKTKRFIQISTIAVHGLYLGRRGDPLSLDPVRSTYALAKHFSEQDVIGECKKGNIDSVILRMGHIYGPYAVGGTVGQRDLVRSDALFSIDQWRNPSNTVFVDNVIDSIIAAIEYPSALNGAIFYITDVPNKSWYEFYEPLFTFTGKNITQVPDISFNDLQKIMRFYQRNIFCQSVEFIQEMLFRPILQKEHLKNMREKRKYQKLFNMIETIMPDCFFRYFKKAIFQTPTSVKNLANQRIDGIIFDMACSYASNVEIPVHDAVAMLGYKPATNWSKAKEITLQWLKSIE